MAYLTHAISVFFIQYVTFRQKKKKKNSEQNLYNLNKVFLVLEKLF